MLLSTKATESHGTHDAFDAGVKVAENFMLPESQYGPAQAAVSTGDSLVPVSVPFQFSIPERDVRFWTATVIAAPVPEARVDKDNYSSVPDSEIGGSKQLRVLPVSDTRAPNASTHEQLDSAIALLDERHHTTSFLSADRVHIFLDLRLSYAYLMAETGSNSSQYRVPEQGDR